MSKKPGLKKNFIYNISFQILTIVLPLITAPYVTRTLGAKSLGVYSKSQALAHYFLIFAMLGVRNYGNRSIARVRDDRDLTSRTFWEIYTFQLMTAVLSTAVYWVYCLFYVRENRLIYMMQAFYVMSGMVDVNWYCFGMEKFRLTTIRSTIVRLASAAAVFLFVRDRDDLWLYTFIASSSFVFSAVAVWPFIMKHIDFVRPTWAGIRRHIKPNLVLFWVVIAVSLYNIMDKLMLGMFSPDEEVAFYSYAERIVTIPTTLILALENVIMPRMSNLYANKEKADNIQFLMDTVMMFAMFMAAAMAFGLAGIADTFAPWFYGKEFTRCGYFIFLLCPVIVMKGWAGALRTQFIIPTGRDRIFVTSLSAGAVVNLILNAILIPRYSGVGAIIGTIAAEFAVCFIQFYWCRRDIDIKNYLINGFSFCVVGAIMFFAIRTLPGLMNNTAVTIVLQVVSGAVIYVLLACLFMVKIRKKPVLVNEGLKMLRIKKRF